MKAEEEKPAAIGKVNTSMFEQNIQQNKTQPKPVPAKPKVEEEQPKPAAIGKVNTSMFEQNI